MKRNRSELQLITDFKEGDLLYGLEKRARTLFRDDLKTKILENREKNCPDRIGKKVYLTIDDIHNDVMKDVFFGENYNIHTSPLQTPTRLRMKEFLAPGNPFHPAIVLEKENQFSSPTSRKLESSCKQALITHQSKIRFCLDGLNMDTLRNPTHAHYYSFTSIELRFCAQNWNNPRLNLSDRVVFYYQGNRVDAPWKNAKSPKDWLNSFPNKNYGNARKINSTPDKPDKTGHFALCDITNTPRSSEPKLSIFSKRLKLNEQTEEKSEVIRSLKF